MTTTSDMISLHQLTKFIDGNRIVEDISFSVGKGEILGFVGPNGAGKSTTLRMLACATAPTRGTATIAGLDLIRDEMDIRRILGFQPETPALYDFMKVRHYLRFMAELRGIPTSGVESAVDEAIERCKLSRMSNREIGKLSKGYRQRVGLAQAIIARPTVLLLDEPTASLDPEQINETRQIIRDYAVNAAVIFSTHIMQEIRHVCDRIAIIKNGTIRHTETLRSADGSADERRTVVLHLRGDRAVVAQISAGFGMVSLEPSSAGDTLRLEVQVSSDERELSQLMKALLARDVYIREVVPYESDIESKILAYMKD